jgi:hypothetical protein
MAKYDSPGFAGAFPGGPFNAHDDGGTAPGSAGAESHPGGGGELGRPIVTTNYGNSSQVAADLPTTSQGFKSTNAASDPLADGFSGHGEGSAAWGSLDGSSHVKGPGHPNAQGA